jgi:hypothetical protein
MYSVRIKIEKLNDWKFGPFFSAAASKSYPLRLQRQLDQIALNGGSWALTARQLPIERTAAPDHSGRSVTHPGTAWIGRQPPKP